jgi:hypothetical protein
MMNLKHNRNKNNRNSGKRGKKPHFNRQKKGSGNRNYRGNRNRPRLSEWDKLEKSYMILMEKYLHARRKYFDNFYKASGEQLKSLEKNFYRTLDEVRKFEEEVPEQFKEKFEGKGNKEALDLIYSENHQIEPFPEVTPIPEEEIVDPHLLTTQLQADFKEDTEESSGTMDDYKRYKGL